MVKDLQLMRISALQHRLNVVYHQKFQSPFHNLFDSNVAELKRTEKGAVDAEIQPVKLYLAILITVFGITFALVIDWKSTGNRCWLRS